MKTVQRFTNPEGQPRYEVTDDWGCAAFLTPQDAIDYIAQHHAGEIYVWNVKTTQICTGDTDQRRVR